MHTLCSNITFVSHQWGEPHIDGFAVEFVLALCRKLLPALILLLILLVLMSFVNSKTIRHRLPYVATARTETTRGPTYSMTKAIGATPWQKRFHPSVPLFALPL